MANKKGGNTVNTVWEIAEPIAEGLGLKLWDVRYVKEGAQWYLRITIDKDGGIGIEDCENMSRAIDTPLDEKDPCDQQYILEVSSPGVERELTREEHFEAYTGADIMVKMIRPIEGIGKEFKGKLKSADKHTATITDHSGENEITINKKDAVYIKLDDFDF
ncbi:MAG: ribosome maturation factor RimP [Oscillospiraceae bacterium]|nr:ribosome maturation factor RimP [Oscillospiraceae bacterium]